MLNFRNAALFGSLFALGACPADDDDDIGGTETDPSASATTPTGSTDPSATDVTETDPSDTTEDPTSVDTTAGPDGMCLGVGGPNADGEGCAANADCASGVCSIFTDVPVNADAVCDPTPDSTDQGCNTRITGTVYDFSTLAPVEGAAVKAAAALQAITDPSGATAIVEATSGADGRIDVTTETPISAAIALIALVEAPGSYLTATGLASPAEGSAYAVANAIHDLWLVPTVSLTAWNTALEGDADVAAIVPAVLPLGDAGGIVGLVRDATGAPIAGAVVEPDVPSNAIVRYVAVDNTIVADATTETGIFIIVGAVQTGEDFNATVDGAVVGSARAGTANGAVFTSIINAQ